MAEPNVSSSGYGKNDVCLMRIRKEGEVHYVTELKVSTQLQLATISDYELGDNRDVVATDTQKNTVLVLAKQSLITSPEQFAMLLCNHFLSTYKQVVRCQIHIEQAPWQRMKQGGMEHAHAFISEPSAIRFAEVSQLREGVPMVSGGIKDMKIMKTTKSGFEGFVQDKFTTLPETSDRTFCTNVYLKYDFCNDVYGVDFNATWEIVKTCVLDVFAGPPRTGIYSPSVQNTMFDTSKLIFAKVPKVTNVDIHMPNIHYYIADMRKFLLPNNGELLLPSSTPHGMIMAKFSRKTQAKM